MYMATMGSHHCHLPEMWLLPCETTTMANWPKTMLVLKKHRKKPRSSGRHVSPIQSGEIVNIMPMAMPFTPLPARCIRQSGASCWRTTPAAEMSDAARMPHFRPYFSSRGAKMKVATISVAGAIEFHAER